jgi:hypothetical protein
MIIKFVRKIAKPVVNVVKAVAPIAAPVLAIAVPGIGTAIGTALGASAAAAPIVGSAVLGAAGSAIGGKDPITGAVLGGGAAYLSGLIGAPSGLGAGGGAGELASVGETGYGLTGPISSMAPSVPSAFDQAVTGALSGTSPIASSVQVGTQGFGSAVLPSGAAVAGPGLLAAASKPVIGVTEALRGASIANQLLNPPEFPGMQMDGGQQPRLGGVDYSGLLGLLQARAGTPNVAGLLSPAQIRYPSSLLG